MSEQSYNKGLDDAACGVPPRSEYATDQGYQDGYSFGDHRHENYQEPPEQPRPDEPQPDEQPFPKVFRTDILGVGPWCIEFDDGEIITTKTEARARLIAQLQPSLGDCRECDGVGYFDQETGGCDADGENDTRETIRVGCPRCQGTGQA